MQIDSVLGRSPIEWLQAILGLAILAWVLSQPDWAAVGTALSELPAGIVIAVLLVTGLGLTARFYTWVALIEVFRPTSINAACRIDLAVNFINQLLPSRVSGRVAAPVVVREFTGAGWDQSVAIVVTHTALFALVYGIVSLGGLVAGVTRFPAGIALLILLSTAAYLVVGVMLLLIGSRLDTEVSWLVTLPGIQWLVTKLRARFPFEGADVGALVRRVIADRGVVLRYIVAWIIALALVPGLRVWLLFEGTGTSFDAATLLPLYIVAAYSVTLLPLTPGGIGVTEATATVVFVALGVPEAIVVPVILLDRFVGVYLPAVIGWYPTLDLDLPEPGEFDGKES